ncbi:unnamed protein product [Clonostachys rosea f. rosea IK726]|uniref:Uncharacterized protein n=2 Tax=Bionectria ochroleuca TaxID=29856 RepID=A0A0B7JY86_BIOOC|nr:unnamed protein product [Clonostachys rosea f. rosea IK726]
MDLDIEMGDAAQQPFMEEPTRDNDILQPDEPEELGEVIEDETTAADNESQTVVPNKINVRGVDTLHTDDIKTYVRSHFGSVDRVEWIDDTSANLVFSSESVARDALVALSNVEIADATALGVGESLPGKAVDGKPDISLQIRFAHDPEERRRRNQENRSRYRERDSRGSGRYRRRGSDDDEIETYEASMYDDAPRASRRRSESRERSRERRPSYSQQNKGKELFSSGRPSRGRGRSASPGRDRDGDMSMDESASSAGNRIKARSLKDRITSDRGNRSKELFPTKATGQEDHPKIVDVPHGSNSNFNIRGSANPRSNNGGFSIKGTAASAKELFPTKLGGSNTGKELIGAKKQNRKRAEDLFG